MQKLILSAGFIALATAAIGLAGCHTAVNTAFALTSSGQIIEFQTGSTSSSTGAVTSTATIGGLPGGQSVMQLAFRPSNGVFYGVTTANEVCTLDPVSGLATLVSVSPFTADTLTNVAAAFDPVNDQLRVTATSSASPTGLENLRVDPDDGSLLNGTSTLAYTSGPTGNPQIRGLAYTDAIAGATSTTLFGLDVASQQLVRIGNVDTSAATDTDSGAVQTIGSPRLTFGPSLGFAIAPDGLAYAALAPAGSNASLYAIDLNTGAATSLGSIGTTGYTVISLVIAP